MLGNNYGLNSTRNSGKVAWNRGKRMSLETRQKQQIAAIIRSQTEEGKLNSSKAGRLGAAARWTKVG